VAWTIEWTIRESHAEAGVGLVQRKMKEKGRRRVDKDRRWIRIFEGSIYL
jgi:hypothetical protein